MNAAFAGVDVGGTRIKIGLADDSGRLLSSRMLETHDCGDAKGFLTTVAEEITKEAKAVNVVIRGVGLGCPGRIDFASGRVVWLKTKLEFLEGIPLSADLRERLGCPVTCDNDVNAILAGEMKFGRGRGYQDVVALTIGTGIGGALVIGGKMVRGHNWATGHFGYMSLDPCGPRHVCGNTGIVEEHASQSGILRRSRAALDAGERSSLAELFGRGEEPGLREVFLAAQEGDPLAHRLADRMISELGVLVSNLIYALDPELILIGGGLTSHHPELLDVIRREATARIAYLPADGTEIQPMALGDVAGVLGGVALAIDTIGKWDEVCVTGSLERRIVVTKHMTMHMPRWAEGLMKKHGVSEPPAAGIVPEWLRHEVESTPLWYIIREAKEVRHKHPYLLVEELRKQPRQWREIVDTMRPEIAAIADAIASRGTKEILFTGCGSAFFTAIHGEFVVERLAGIHCRAIESFELLHYFPNIDPKRTVVVAHSGTGGSIETRDALQKARDLGCFTIAMVNTPGSPLAQIGELGLCYETAQGCGPCISVISTRIVMQTLLGLELGRRLLGSGPELAAPNSQLARCSSVGQAFLQSQEEVVRSLAQRFRDIASFFLVGTGPNYFSAREGTLKIEEESICVSKAYRPGDFHHDVISILGPSNCTIAIAGNESTNPRIADCLDVARAAESNTIALVFDGNDSLVSHAEHVIRLEGGLDELLTPIPLTLVFQLFGYYRGVARGFNPDTLRTDHWPNAKAWMTAFPIGTH